LKIDSVDQKFNWLECGNFSQDAGTPGTERAIAFSQLAVKGFKDREKWEWHGFKGLREMKVTWFQRTEENESDMVSKDREKWKWHGFKGQREMKVTWFQRTERNESGFKGLKEMKVT
jgi:hypothetical protein